MKARTNNRAFRLRSHRGHLTMPELIAFSRHVERILSRSVWIEGVDSARPLADGSVAIKARSLTVGDPATGMDVNVTQPMTFEFPRTKGLALWQHLNAYHDFIMPRIDAFKLRSDDILQSREDAGTQRVEFKPAP